MPAVTSVTNFSDGNVLTATALNAVNCGIHVYADAAARNAAYGGSGERTLVEGEYAYLLDTNQTLVYDGSNWVSVGGKVSQVLSTVKLDTFSLTTSVTTYTDVTGLSVTITPTSVSNKVLVLANCAIGVSSGSFGFARLAGGNAGTYIGNAAGSRIRAAQGVLTASASTMGTHLIYLDSPATTSATTYKVQISATSGANIHLNRSHDDTDSDAFVRSASTITVMEILG
jgi:hypothetical protein